MSPAFSRRPRPMRALAFLTIGAFALVGCAETEFLVHTAKQVRGGDTISTGDGRYKVGSPYQIKNVWYYPAEDYEYSETGIASWYGPNFHGKKTANGETYNQNDLTAAHRTLPMPSAVRVTNLENGRSIVLRINDRGPFARGRIIDVSRQGAQLLGFQKNGVAKVRVDVLPDESRQLKVAAINGSSQQIPVSASPREVVVSRPLPAAQGQSPSTASAPAPVQAPVRAESLPPVAEPNLSKEVEVLPVSPTGIYVQAGAFSRLENALRMRDQIYSMGPTQISRFAVSGTEIYRVRIGPLDTVEMADATLTQVLGAGVSEAQLIVE
ncbi:MAG: septal ring lytic transglycosylase RlpA family protein [Alphaproteobacteria bacterium]|nr:septal ring lytic transglycosylase RlpA family protein [Alphaproteobacteria bacterium]